MKQLPFAVVHIITLVVSLKNVRTAMAVKKTYHNGQRGIGSIGRRSTVCEIFWVLIAVATVDFGFLAFFILSNSLPVYHYGDIRSYVIISQTFYVGRPDRTPWFPLHPMFIGIVNVVVGDSFFSAHLVSRMFHVLSVFVFYHIVRGRTRRPKLLTFFFSTFPPEWPFTALVGLSEPVFMFFTLASYCFFVRRRFSRSFLGGALAVLTRPFGILMFFFYLPFLLGKRLYGSSAYSLIMFVPVVALFGYFGWLFGDFLIYLHAQPASSPLAQLMPFGSYLFLAINPIHRVASLTSFAFLTLYIVGFVYLWLKGKWLEGWWIFLTVAVIASTAPNSGFISNYVRYLIQAFPIMFFFDDVTKNMKNWQLMPLLTLYVAAAFTYPFIKVPDSFMQALLSAVL